MKAYELPDGTRLVNVHGEDDCEGRTCVVHNPTDHHLVDSRLIWNQETGMFERECPHGEIVLDPDMTVYLDESSVWTYEPFCCSYRLKGGPEVQCSECGSVIRSIHRHNLVSCGCGKTFVDGGADYTRVGGPGRIVGTTEGDA